MCVCVEGGGGGGVKSYDGRGALGTLTTSWRRSNCCTRGGGQVTAYSTSVLIKLS